MRQQDVTNVLGALPERCDARQDLRRVAGEPLVDQDGSTRSVHQIDVDQPGQHGEAFNDGI